MLALRPHLQYWYPGVVRDCKGLSPLSQKGELLQYEKPGGEGVVMLLVRDEIDTRHIP